MHKVVSGVRGGEKTCSVCARRVALASLLAQLRRQPRYASAICPSTATLWQTRCSGGV